MILIISLSRTRFIPNKIEWLSNSNQMPVLCELKCTSLCEYNLELNLIPKIMNLSCQLTTKCTTCESNISNGKMERRPVRKKNKLTSLI
jgi:hypothetical protein